MLCVVTGVGFLIHIYSVGYMGDEDGYWRFFAYMNLFLFFMLTLVLAENFLLMFVGWEGVGLASYLLIGFYFTRDSAANAGKKAFIVNRIGDFGFLLAMFLLIAHFGTLSFSEVFSADRRASRMAGRLPHCDRALPGARRYRQVRADSALRLAARRHGRPHSGFRAHPRRHHGHRRRLHDRAHPRHLRPLPVRALAWSPSSAWPPPSSPPPSAWSRPTSSACSPTPPSRSSATCSSACGVAAYSAGIFHLVTHAFFKALLFLAAGSVIHALCGEQDMRAMGGLRQKIPITFWTMTAAVFAISGFPPLAGFVSKDEILYQTFISPNGGKILWAVGLVTAGLTSFYMFRLWYLTFFGESRAAAHEEEAAVHARRTRSSSSKPIRDPRSSRSREPVGHARPAGDPRHSLASSAAAMGWPEALGGSNWFSHFLEPAGERQLPRAIATGTSSQPDRTRSWRSRSRRLRRLRGWLAAAHSSTTRSPSCPHASPAQFHALYALLKNKYWVDEIYAALIVAPVLFIARWVLGVLIDRGVIDGGTLTAGYTAQGLGALVARIQSGNIRSYAGWLALFAAAPARRLLLRMDHSLLHCDEH